MADTNMTIEQVETLLVGYPDSPFFIRQQNVIPNVSWGFINHEADLLVVTKSRALTEVEIKRSWSDFKADFKKRHTHNDNRINKLYYAVPESIGEKVFNWLYEGEYKTSSWLHCTYSKVTGYTEHNPNKCGLILYKDSDFKHPASDVGINVYAQPNSDYRLTDEDMISLLRLGNMRVWNAKKKLAKLQSKEE